MTRAIIWEWRQFWAKQRALSKKKNTKGKNHTKEKLQKKSFNAKNKLTTNKRNKKQYQQTDLHKRNITEEDGEEYGDTLNPKEEKTLRVVLHNINNLTENHKSNKSREVVQFIIQKQVGVMMLNEVGLCWPAVKDEDQWFARIQGKFGASTSQFAYNATELEKTDVKQPGGVGIVVTDDEVHRVIEKGKDTTLMGRWAWILLEGRQHHRTRVLTAYNPNTNEGPETVYSQQRRHLNRLNRHKESVKGAFLKDLKELLVGWKNAGDNIIVGMDANEDVRKGQVNDMMRDIGMRESIITKHKGRPPPATCNKNKSRIPIDGIWTTQGITAVGAGYLPMTNLSDHRALWVDVRYQEVYGFKIPTMKRSIRRLNTKNPRMVQHYNERIKEKFRDANLFNKMNLLRTQAKRYGWNEELEEKFNKLHRIQQEIRMSVEKKIRKLRMGGVPWSPKLQIYRDTIEMWSAALKRKQGLSISNTMIRRLIYKVQPTRSPYHLPIEDLIQELKDAHKHYREAKKVAGNWRDEFIPALAEARAEHNGTTMEHELKQLLQADNQKKTWRNIKRMRNKMGQQATTMIQVVENGELKTITEKEDMELACIEENISRFSQSEDTPPLQSPLYEELGRWGEGPAVSDILNGTYEPPEELDQYTKKLLNEMYMPEAIKKQGQIDMSVSVQEHRTGWRKQKENISAMPFGPSFSHFKASSQDEELAEFETQIRTLPMIYGFSPLLWREITDVEILKKAGVYDITKMRTIQLMHSEFNFNNKKLGRDMMNWAERAGTIADEQNGGRIGHRAIFAALNKKLTYDLLRLKHYAGALGSVDFRACYDRVVHNMAAVAMMRQGVPLPVIKSLFETLQEAVHKITTAYGVSDLSYGNDRIIPLQGLGQGNGMAPPGWAVLSTPLINMVKKAGFGLNLQTALSMTVLNWVCFAFVDDSDLTHTASNDWVRGEDIATEMQKCIDHWEGGVRATGGAIREDKSYWYLIDFQWNGDRWEYRLREDMEGKATVRTYQGTRVELDREEMNTAKETLGVFLAPDGSKDKQVEALKNKATQFAECIRTGWVSRSEAWTALNATIMKTLEYPMECQALTEEEWTKIMTPLMKNALPRIGIVRTFPKQLIYGPKGHLGRGCKYPYFLQFVKQLQVIMSFDRLPKITKQLIQGTMEEITLAAGVSGNISERRWDIIAEYVSNCWWIDLITILYKNGIKIHDEWPQLKKCSEDDEFLMEKFIDARYTSEALRMLNECRLYLRVTTLAEIASLDGRYIERWAWNGEQNPDNFRESDYRWPRRPTKLKRDFWNLWRGAIRECFLSPENSLLKLRRTTGRWHQDQLEGCKWKFEAEKEELYHLEGRGWRIYRKLVRYTTRIQGMRFAWTDRVVDTCTGRECTVLRRNNGKVAMTGIARPLRLAQRNDTRMQSWMETRLKNLSLREQWAIGEIQAPDNGQAAARAIADRKGVAVSDGSFKNSRGTSAWLVHAEDSRENTVLGTNHVVGRKKDQSAYRSELAGVYGILTTVTEICRIHDITTGCLTIGLDGKQAMIDASRSYFPPANKTDGDILRAIRRKTQQLSIDLRWKWIEGHQDDHRDIDQLDSWAQDNVIVDYMAKLYWKRMEREKQPIKERSIDEGIHFTIRDAKPSCLDVDEVYATLWGNRTKEYWSRKFGWEARFIEMIDWEAMDATSKLRPDRTNQRLMKMASGHFATGKKMMQWQMAETSKCPRCNAMGEDNIHIIRCQHRGAQQTWRREIREFEQWLDQYHTDPFLQEFILTSLQAWRDRDPDIPPPSPHLNRLAEEQRLIGWFPSFFGFLSKEWGRQQERFYRLEHQDPTRYNGKRWVRLVIRRLNHIILATWKHRNEIKHSPVAQNQDETTRLLNDVIKKQFTQGEAGLRNQDLYLFRNKTEEHIIKKYTRAQKKQWLESVEQARAHQLQHTAQSRFTQCRRLMETWLKIRQG